MTLTSRRPVVLLDVDGISADFTAAGCKVIEEVTGRPAPVSGVTQWAIEKCFPLSADEEAEVIRRWSLPGFCANIPPYPEALYGVARLKEIADVHPVTAHFFSNPTWAHERDQWLSTHFKFHPSQVVHTHAKYLVSGDVFVDDKPSHVIAWKMRHQLDHGLLWRRPYNAGDSLISRGFSIDSWDDLYAFVYGRRGRWGPLGPPH